MGREESLPPSVNILSVDIVMYPLRCINIYIMVDMSFAIYVTCVVYVTNIAYGGHVVIVTTLAHSF